MLARILFVFLMVTSQAATAAEPLRLAQAQSPMARGTPQEQAACRRDSTKFCREELGDDMRVLACLRAHRNRISHACRAVLGAHGR